MCVWHFKKGTRAKQQGVKRVLTLWYLESQKPRAIPGTEWKAEINWEVKIICVRETLQIKIRKNKIC